MQKMRNTAPSPLTSRCMYACVHYPRKSVRGEKLCASMSPEMIAPSRYLLSVQGTNICIVNYRPHNRLHKPQTSIKLIIYSVYEVETTIDTTSFQRGSKILQPHVTMTINCCILYVFEWELNIGHQYVSMFLNICFTQM